MMNKNFSRRLLSQLTRQCCASVFALTCLPMVGAQDLPGAPEPPQITRVEEDWVALIRLPDDITSAPQILNVISPDRSLSGAFGMVELNHASFPDFQEGGLQLQSWQGETMSGVAYSSETRKLFHDYDRLEYTVAMETDGTTLTFELINGRSRTWGWFARSGINTQVPLPGATLANYDPTFSVEKTNVNVGAHRVDVLYLRQVRYHYDDGSTTTDDTMRVIHRFRDLVEDVSLADYDANPDYYNIDITE
jgi:hypothetical protein